MKNLMSPNKLKLVNEKCRIIHVIYQGKNNVV